MTTLSFWAMAPNDGIPWAHLTAVLNNRVHISVKANFSSTLASGKSKWRKSSDDIRLLFCSSFDENLYKIKIFDSGKNDKLGSILLSKSSIKINGGREDSRTFPVKKTKFNIFIKYSNFALEN